MGSDLIQISGKTVDELKQICRTTPNCVCFNTLGFLKYNFKSEQLVQSPYFKETDGIYVLNDRPDTITVKMVCDFATTEEQMKSYTRMLKSNKRWNNIILTSSSSADYYAILNRCMNTYFDPKRSVVFRMEPSRLTSAANDMYGSKGWGPWKDPNRYAFLQVRDHAFAHNNSEWHLAKTYEQLMVEPIIKTKTLSVVTSANNWDPGHKLRIDFLKYLESREDGMVDIFGRCQNLGFKNYKGELPPENKISGLYPYKYTIACENNAEHNYFTEKLNDAILSECLCFYWGCPNVDDYYKDAYIRLELTDFEKDYNMIKTMIANDEWSKRLPRIKEAKYKILNTLQIMPVMERLIAVHRDRSVLNTFFDKIFVINLARSTDRMKKFTENMQKAGITNYERFNAIDIEASKKYNWPTPTLHRTRRDINNAAQLACKLSHWEVVRLARERKYNSVLICEDDTIIDNEIAGKLNLAIKEFSDLNLKWDLLWLHCLYNKIGERKGNYIWKLKYSPSCVCYAVSSSCYDLIIDTVEQYKEFPIDDIYCNIIQPKVNAYCTNPNIIHHDWDGDSTISTSTKKNNLNGISTVISDDVPDYDIVNSARLGYDTYLPVQKK